MRVYLVAALLVIAAVLLVWSASKLSAHGQQQRSIGRRSLGRVNASSPTSPSSTGTDAPLIFRYVDEMPANKSLPWFVTISKSPRVLYFPALLTADEAGALIKLGEESLAPSGVWHGDDVPSKSPPPKTSHHRRQHTHQPHEKAQGVQRRHVLSVDEEGDDTTFGDRPVASDHAAGNKKKPKKKAGPRTSSGTRLPAKHPVVKRIDRRILDAFRRQFSGAHAERIQLLRYEAGEKYNGHLDSFGGIKGRSYKASLKQKLEQRGGDLEEARQHSKYVVLERAVTLLLYLSEVPRGGNTSMPYVPASTASGSGDGFRRDHDDPCDATRFYQMVPKTGAALAFYSLHEDGTEDPTALHMGCPVLEGTKWVATKWLMVPLPFPHSLK
jgi:hypothetical protein